MAETNKKIMFGATAGIATAVAALLSGIYDREGGYVNDKLDRGGETNHGVTKVVARAEGYKGDMRNFPKFCYTLKDVCADKIYYESYIVKPGFVPVLAISEPVGDEVVDTGINMGPARPSRWLQESLNEACGNLSGKPKLVVDGKIGKGTTTYMDACKVELGAVKFCTTMLDKLDAKQKARYYAIVKANPSQKRFLKGWINHRIGNVDRKRCAA